jgi:hypothetical protein
MGVRPLTVEGFARKGAGVMDERQRIKQYIERTGARNPERIRAALCNSAGGPVRTAVIREVLAQVSGPIESTGPSRPTAAPAARKARTMAEFRKVHDYALMLKRAVIELGEGYLLEHELQATANIPKHLWRRFAELPDFNENKLKLGGQTYWAPARVIREMKQIVGGA